MIEAAGLAISAGVAHVATNLDNLAIMVGLILTTGRLRVIAGYVLAQCFVLIAAFIVAEGVDTELPVQVGYLGLIPIGLGVVALLRRKRETEEPASIERRHTHFLAVTALFLSVSFDTFAVFAALLADSQQVFSLPILVGALLSTAALCFLSTTVASFAPSRLERLGRLEWLAPYVMIAIGLYVVLNTTTDVI